MLIRGRCHCGNIAFTLDWTPDPPQIPARACTCSFCTRHGGVWTSHPSASLAIAIADPARVSRYAFGTRTATFHVCATCGVVPVVTCTLDDRVHAVVNVNAFESVDRARVRQTPASFEDEAEDARLARRKRNWIAHVSFVERLA